MKRLKHIQLVDRKDGGYELLVELTGGEACQKILPPGVTAADVADALRFLARSVDYSALRRDEHDAAAERAFAGREIPPPSPL